MGVLTSFIAIVTCPFKDDIKLQNALAATLKEDEWQTIPQIRAAIKSRGSYGEDSMEAARLEMDSHLKVCLRTMEMGCLVEKRVGDDSRGTIVYRLNQNGLTKKPGSGRRFCSANRSVQTPA